MRAATEKDVWSALSKRTAREQAPEPFEVGADSYLDLSQPCIVLGGRNGSGKSRVLQSIKNLLGTQAVRLDLHHICEQALAVLRYRTDAEGLIEEATDLALDPDRLDDVQRIVGREYDQVEWLAIDVEFGDETLESVRETFRWGQDQVLVPFVRARYAGVDYDARSMGLGEFSVHVLFWILEQYKDQSGLTLLLDEPDAYLPPVGVGPLLERLLLVCDERDWNLVLATHSEELINEASRRKVFHLVRMNIRGEIQAFPSSEDADVGAFLLSRPAYEYLLFVEDESAWQLARALINSVDRVLSRQVLIVWGKGYSYMTAMRPYLPKPPYAEVKFAYVPDGDQRGKIEKSKSGEWRTIFLPTNQDPDALLKALRKEPETLAHALAIPLNEITRFLDTIEGDDPHDWVNKLGAEYERQRVLHALTALWVSSNKDLASEFVAEIRKI